MSVLLATVGELRPGLQLASREAWRNEAEQRPISISVGNPSRIVTREVSPQAYLAERSGRFTRAYSQRPPRLDGWPFGIAFAIMQEDSPESLAGC
jgi:hypothetical protein